MRRGLRGERSVKGRPPKGGEKNVRGEKNVSLGSVGKDVDTSRT